MSENNDKPLNEAYKLLQDIIILVKDHVQDELCAKFIKSLQRVKSTLSVLKK